MMKTLTLVAVLLAICGGIAYASVTRNGVVFQGSAIVTDCSVNYSAGPPPYYWATQAGPPLVTWIIDDPADIKPAARREAVRKALDAAAHQGDANNQITINNGDCSSAASAPPPR